MTKHDGGMHDEVGPPWSECEHPELWAMWDAQAVEVEVARWLSATVAMLKPMVVLDTGTYIGVAAHHLALGCRDNGFGHVYSQDVEPERVAKATEAAENMGIGDWLTVRVGDHVTDLMDAYGIGEVDLFFSDAGTPYEPIRVDEVKAVLPHLSRHGVIIAHDTSPAWMDVRAGLNGLEDLGACRVMHLPTPRGVSIVRRA